MAITEADARAASRTAPVPTPVRQTEPDKPKTEGSKRKGKKGDGDN